MLECSDGRQSRMRLHAQPDADHIPERAVPLSSSQDQEATERIAVMNEQIEYIRKLRERLKKEFPEGNRDPAILAMYVQAVMLGCINHAIYQHLPV